MYGDLGRVHPVYMAGKRVRARFKKPQFHPSYIRQWRENRGLTLEQLADRVGTTHASLSRIERGMQPYGQPLLEAIAEALQTDPASLLVRNPQDPDGIWSIWDRAQPGERRMIVDIAKTLIKTGTK
jgi:transcriptional regulator with XRE-family HTH domain